MKPLISNVDVSGRKRQHAVATKYKALTASLREQAAQIQKVSTQLELSKSAPRTVLNRQ
jgi:aspartate ammonia-lyase